MPKAITIAGEQFEVPSAEELGLGEGYQCDAAAARQLYQVRNENIRNNTAKQVKEFLDKGDKAGAADLVAKYAQDYTFSMPGTGGGTRTMDPVEREARAMARRALVKQSGKKVKDIDKDALEAAIDKVLEQNPNVMKAAKKVVADREKVLEGALGELNL